MKLHNVSIGIDSTLTTKTAVGLEAVHSGSIQIAREGNGDRPAKQVRETFFVSLAEFGYILGSTFVEVLLKFCYGAAQCKIFI